MWYDLPLGRMIDAPPKAVSHTFTDRNAAFEEPGGRTRFAISDMGFQTAELDNLLAGRLNWIDRLKEVAALDLAMFRVAVACRGVGGGG